MNSRYPKTSSVESDQSSVQEQEFPMDLSMRSSMSSGSASDSMSLSLSASTSASGPVSSKFLFPSGQGRPHPLISSSSHSYRSLSSESGSKVTCAHQVSLTTSLPQGVTLETPSPGGAQWLCPLCNQGFSLHDRLAKHMASRHKVTKHCLQSM